MTKARLQKLNALYTHANNKPALPEALAELTHRHTTINITHDQITETKLHKYYKPQSQQDLKGAARGALNQEGSELPEHGIEVGATAATLVHD